MEEVALTIRKVGEITGRQLAVSDLEYRNGDIQAIDVINVNARTNKMVEMTTWIFIIVRYFTDIKVYIFEDSNDSL